MQYYKQFPNLEEIRTLKHTNAAEKIIVIPDNPEESQGHFDPDNRVLKIYSDISLQYDRTINDN